MRSSLSPGNISNTSFEFVKSRPDNQIFFPETLNELKPINGIQNRKLLHKLSSFSIDTFLSD